MQHALLYRRSFLVQNVFALRDGAHACIFALSSGNACRHVDSGGGYHRMDAVAKSAHSQGFQRGELCVQVSGRVIINML